MSGQGSEETYYVMSCQVMSCQVTLGMTRVTIGWVGRYFATICAVCPVRVYTTMRLAWTFSAHLSSAGSGRD